MPVRRLNEILIFAMLFITAPMEAQWLDHPTPGIPRTANGKPNLSAQAPKTSDGKPDLSGIWTMNAGKYTADITADLKPGEVPPWAEALYKTRGNDLGKDSPTAVCLPMGPVINFLPVSMKKIMQTPGLIAILYDDLTYRQIFLDGRELPKDPNPSFMGYSVGHWEGDTLVVESNGFKDRTWLDFGGHPHSEELRITERIRRRDFGHMDIEETLEDSKVYPRPWTITILGELMADTELLEYVCAENEKDREHLVGKASDDRKKAVKVAPEVLARYVGIYDFRIPDNPTQVIAIAVTNVGGELVFDFLGDKSPLIPLSNTAFLAAGNAVTFVANDRGVVTHLMMNSPEGDQKAVRRPAVK
jgi:hypothetical protein